MAGETERCVFDRVVAIMRTMISEFRDLSGLVGAQIRC